MLKVCKRYPAFKPKLFILIHLSVSDNMGIKRTRTLLCDVDPDTTFKVPEFFRLDFANLNVRKLNTYKYSAPSECADPQMLKYEGNVKSLLEEERKWLRDCVEMVSARQDSDDLALSNLVYHSRQDDAVKPQDQLTISSLLPVQTEPANTLEMMQHCIDLIRAAKDVLNPSQKTTFDVSDNPMYALSKQIQFAYQEEYSLQSYLPLMGDLHTEQVCLICVIDIVRLKVKAKRITNNEEKLLKQFDSSYVFDYIKLTH
jgi:hypothetical protein